MGHSFAPLEAGSYVVGKRFQILRYLGSGGMGVVYLAHDRERRSEVALKTLRDFEAAALYHLKREFRALADVIHPNLAALYELATEDDTWFLAMEYVEGTTFTDYVTGSDAPAAAPPLAATLAQVSDSAPTLAQPVEQSGGAEVVAREAWRAPQFDRLRSALRQLAEGVSALHVAGKLHRDLKPSNVLVTREDRVVILDFGLATELEGAAQESSWDRVVGTVAYMSPEQAAGHALTEASDWYSVGVMLYEALTGRLPFVGRIADVLASKQTRDARPPAELNPAIPAELDRLAVELLRRRPEDRPAGPEIRQRLGLASGPPSPQAPARPRRPAASSLLGRERHLEALRDALRTVRSGHTVARLLRGRSGMGKSAIVQTFLASLDAADVVVLAGRCYEQESVPYKALDTVVDELSKHLMRLPGTDAAAVRPRDCAALARLFPVLNRVRAIAEAPRRISAVPDPQEMRRRAFAALRELLTRLGDRSVLVLYVDDLQWGDVDSAALFTELLRPPNPPALLLIVCCRDEDIDTLPTVRTLLEPFRSRQIISDVEEIEVGPLSKAEATGMALTLLGSSGPEAQVAAERIAEESAGNPFFVAELVRHLVSGGAVPTDRGSAGSAISLDAALAERIARLPEDAQRLLTAVAVAARPISAPVAEQAAGLEIQNQTALALLRAGHLVKARGGRAARELESYHDRIRESVVRRLDEEALREWNRRLAFALAGAPKIDHEVLAVHFRGAGMRERAAEHSALAAAAAEAALAFDRAARLYQWVIELRPRSHPEQGAVWARLGHALACAGRGLEASLAYEHAAKTASIVQGLEYRRRAAEQLLRSGHVDEGLVVLETVLSAVGMRLSKSPTGALASLMFRRTLLALRGLRFKARDASEIPPAVLVQIDVCWAVAIGLARIDNIRAADFQTRHLLLALKAGEPYRIARALATETGFSSTGGARTRKRTAQLEKAASDLANQLGNPHALGLVRMAGGVAAYYDGRFQRARVLSEEAETLFREQCTGVAWEINTSAIYALASLYYLGETRELVERMPRRLDEARDRGDLYAAVEFAAGRSALAWLIADDVPRARREVSRAMDTWSRQGFHSQHFWGVFAGVHLELYVGDGQTAWTMLQQRWPQIARSLILRVQFNLVEILGLRARSSLARAEMSPAERAGLLEAAERDARRIRGEKLELSTPVARLVEAGVASLRGLRDQAGAALDEAITGFERLDMAGYAAAARWRRAQLRGEEAGRAEAEAFLRSQAVRRPERVVAMLAPGFPD
jgi:serine/threonine protein kinase